MLILRIFYYIIGILIMSFALTFIYLYTNLFTIGYTFLEYITFILKRWECLLIIPGIILIVYTFRKGD